MAHFDENTTNCQIHTTRSVGPCSNAGSGNCDYRSNCAVLPAYPWQAHHVLPVHSVNAYAADAIYGSYAFQIDKSYKLSPWCINQSDNMVPLALKLTYKTVASIRVLNKPAHDLDHNCTDGYTDEVKEAIAEKIWEKIKEECDNKGKQHFKPADVAAEFKALVTRFKGQLTVRGGRYPGGTAAAYKARGSTVNGWWKSFSMAKTSVTTGRPLANL